MKYLFSIAIFSLVCFSLSAQPFDKAPDSDKKIKSIIEWVRPNLDAKSVKTMVSTFDINGHLLSYTTQSDSSIYNTYHILDNKGRIVETREGQGADLFQTRYTYKPDLLIKETSFRGKVNRWVDFYDKKGSVAEKKNYAKGLELGNNFRLKERTIYEYNNRGQVIGEKIMSYDLPDSKAFNTRKKIYHYHSELHYLTKTVEYDYDGSVSRVEDYAYYTDRKIKSMITNSLKDEIVGTKEFLYKNGKIWQQISTERGVRHVEIYTDGRLIRLRSYNNDKVYRVVDYQYEYYQR
ncbi:MAG: hypothetical protein ACI8P3_001657 [Saprospiraceae bacterium]|jgi:hypothetical protein